MARLSWTTVLMMLGFFGIAMSADEPRKLEFTPGMGEKGFVYVIWPGSYGTTPEMFRQRGGITFLEGPEDTSLDQSYTMDGSLSFRNWFHVSTDLPGIMSEVTDSDEEGWHVYRIRPSMNMVPMEHPHNSYTHLALGGVLWSQVHSAIWVSRREITIGEDAPWRDNPDYDRNWENFGLGLAQPLLSVQSPLRENESHRDRALAFMDFLVEEENGVLTFELRNMLRSLFGWSDVRRFPFLRPGGATPLRTAILESFDWGRINLPRELQRDLATGLPDEELCRSVIRVLRDLGTAVVLGLAQGSMMRRDNQEGCNALADFAQKNQSLDASTDVRIETFTGLDPHVKICKTRGLKEPCVDVPVPRGKCVAIPKDMMGEVSSLRPNAAVGQCQVYRRSDCIDKFITAKSNFQISKHEARENTQSFRCGPDVFLPKSPWEWNVGMQSQHCHRIDSLKFGWKLGSGTWDDLHVSFKECPMPGETNEISDTMSTNWEKWLNINLEQLFGEPRPKLTDVRDVYLMGKAGFWTRTFGSHDFRLKGIQLLASCADSNFTVKWQKHQTINEKLHVGNRLRLASPTTIYPLWNDSISPQDWKGSPPCSHISQLQVTLEIGDEHWAGSVNDIYVNVGKGSFWIMSRPDHKVVRTVGIDLQEAFEKNLVALDELKELSIENRGGGDQVHVQGIIVRATCAGHSQKSLYYDKMVKDWIKGWRGQWHLPLPPDVWIEY
ncbi:Heat-labile enterotoxin IIA, A chain [Ophiocordyceps camponoti-floridani]|uniref:Heat-labile enterotoxin IIA, A chain n=1 Tax=Ophiocordyceps camponoti-floridani TaxID=2030778 RepID=A0A8H4Q314_9HYPO|nr:Heat-labile enterotoxin IIA, A chain [Ophiocordyceps camponoti-floridani]